MPQTEQQWLRQQEKLDRRQAADERLEMLNDEFHSPLSRVVLQRLRHAHDEGRTLAFRSEFSRGSYCVAQTKHQMPVVIYRDLNSGRFRQFRAWIQAEWKRLKDENRTGNDST